MICNKNEKVLVTTDNWFRAPDGEQYNAVFGTVKGVKNDEETLGIKTNRGSTNWYLEIGNMFVAGCQIHYVVKTKSFSCRPPTRETVHEGEVFSPRAGHARIYNADKDG